MADMAMDVVALSAEAEAFFSSAPPLRPREDVFDRLNSFVARHQAEPGTVISQKKVVCVTSGGTTVPLERRCVRFIDNFSSGHRGAASTEYFLKAGYAVIFLQRSGSAHPFCRFLPDYPLLDCFEPVDDLSIKPSGDYFAVIQQAVREHHSATKDGNLLVLQYSTLFEYLQILQMVAFAMNQLGCRAMFYLAAAVSDFYVPWETMEEHKIQSGVGPLDLQLAPVPKMLPLLRQQWAPKAFCVSFKLETDMEVLVNKARRARQRYGMHVVVANELLTRKQQVITITEKEERSLKKDLYKDIEEPLVRFLTQLHDSHQS